jgi:hypothetical protein
MGAEVEKRLVRFAPLTALRERRVTPREVSIVLVGDKRLQLRRKGVGYGKELGKGTSVGYSDPEPTPTMLGPSPIMDD